MSDTPGATTPAGTDGAETERPLTILIGADTFAPDVNGAARFAERLAAGLVERGHDVHVMAPAANRKHGTWKEVHEGQEITAHRLYSWRWYPHDWLRFALPWRIKQNSARVLDAVKPDVVHFQSHIIVGRGLSVEAAEARHPHRRHQPLHAREHARVHPAAQGVAGVGGRARVEGRRAAPSGAPRP